MTEIIRKQVKKTVRLPYTFKITFKKPCGDSKLSENTFNSPLGYSKQLTFHCVLHGFFNIRMFHRIAFQIHFSSLLSLFRIVFRSLTAPLGLPSLSFRPFRLVFRSLTAPWGLQRLAFQVCGRSFDAPGTLQSLLWVSRGLFSVLAPLQSRSGTQNGRKTVG